MTRDLVWRSDGQLAAAGAMGVFPATEVATPEGWRPAGDLAAGDAILTVGRGAQGIVEVCAGSPGTILHLPTGALGNRVAMDLPAGQGLLLEAELAEDLGEEPFAVIPALSLSGWRGVVQREAADKSVRLILPQPGLIYAGPGLLLACAGRQSLEALVRSPGLAALSLASARALVACLIAEEAGLILSRQAALRLPPKRP